MTKTHHFESSGEAYDATQCDETIKTGDVLVIASEGVVGVADTWPIAVTIEPGALHKPAPGRTLLDTIDPQWTKLTPEHFAAALAVAAELGLEVRP